MVEVEAFREQRAGVLSPNVSLKCDPELGEQLRGSYHDSAGYH